MISAAARLVPAPIATQRGDSSSILLMGGSNSRLSGAPAVNILSAATTIDLPLSQIAAMQTVMGFHAIITHQRNAGLRHDYEGIPRRKSPELLQAFYPCVSVSIRGPKPKLRKLTCHGWTRIHT